MSERVGTVENRRRDGTKALERAPAGEKVAHERLAARNQLIGEHVPRTRFQAAGTKRLAKRSNTLGPHARVVVEHDRLAVEQKALAVAGRRVEQLVDQRDEPLAKALGGQVPLAVPVRVRDDVNVEHDGSMASGGGCGFEIDRSGRAFRERV